MDAWGYNRMGLRVAWDETASIATPGSVCTALLQQVMPLLLLVSGPVPPGVKTPQQQVILLTQRIITLPLLLTHLKHSG